MAIAGAWALTGRLGGPPLVPPDGITARIDALGDPIGVDVLPLLADRAADARFIRSGTTTCGGAGRLLRAEDNWVAVNLARDDDLDAVPAWLETDLVDAGPWATVEDVVPTRPANDLVERAELLGLAVAELGEVDPPSDAVRRTRLGAAEPLDRAPLVVDMSSLWAGPLCTRILVDRGATVVKVESPTRPDGARRGPRAFFERLHAGKEMVTLDIGGTELRRLLERADVVVEASRPRALRQHGILAEEIAPRVWLSITGYGRESNRIAFGDDAAVAGGLVALDDDGPCFVADAVADPLTGVAAAAAVLAALEGGGRWLLDASLAGVAAFVAGADRWRPWSPAPQTLRRYLPPTS